MALAATAILAASCAKEVMTKDEFFEGLYEKCTIEADATLPGSGDADSTANTDKAYLDGSGKVIWQNGDQLNVDGTPLTVATIDSGGVRAKFYGTVNGIVDGSYRRFWAAYPATNFATSFTNPNSLSFTLPTTQTIDPSNHSLQGYTYMVGYTRVPQGFHRLQFQMRNMGSVLKLTLKANANDFRKTVDKIEFTSNANLAGTFTVNNNSTSPTITQGSGTNTTLVVNFTGGGLDISSQKTIYVFLPPLSGKSLTMRIYGGYGLVPYVEKTTSNITLERSKKYESSYTNITFDYVFTVNKTNGTKVIFSPGNLQYHAVNTYGNPATHFRFAPNQYNYCGNNNKNASSTYNNWIDLFGWGTSGYNNKYPYETSANNNSYHTGNINNNYDWGRYNKIYNSKMATTYNANTWRLLDSTELDCLMFRRTTGKTINSTSNARYTKAQINTDGTKVFGLILFPDNYDGRTTNGDGVTWGTINASATTTNQNDKTSTWTTKCTTAGWTYLERHGCVFIPAAGTRTNASTIVGLTSTKPQIYWWTSTIRKTNSPYAVDLITYDVAPKVSANAERHWGCSVRLVRNHN